MAPHRNEKRVQFSTLQAEPQPHGLALLPASSDSADSPVHLTICRIASPRKVSQSALTDPDVATCQLPNVRRKSWNRRSCSPARAKTQFHGGRGICMCVPGCRPGNTNGSFSGAATRRHRMSTVSGQSVTATGLPDLFISAGILHTRFGRSTSVGRNANTFPRLASVSKT